MQNRKITAYSKIVAGLPDVPSPSMSALELKQWFDTAPEEVRLAVNGIVDDIISTLGSSYVGSQAITGVTGATVYAQLGALKALIDALELDKAEKTDVYTKLDLLSMTVANSGADKIKASPITGVPGESVQQILQELKHQINSAVSGTIPDGTLGPEKLSFDVATQQELNDAIGAISLTANNVSVADATSLFTSTNVEGALKEAMEKANTAFQQANDVKTNVANAIGAPATPSDTGATLAGYITTEKGKLAAEIGDGDNTSALQYLADRLIVRSNDIATAVSGRGIPATTADTLAQLATKIGQINNYKSKTQSFSIPSLAPGATNQQTMTCGFVTKLATVHNGTFVKSVLTLGGVLYKWTTTNDLNYELTVNGTNLTILARNGHASITYGAHTIYADATGY